MRISSSLPQSDQSNKDMFAAAKIGSVPANLFGQRPKGVDSVALEAAYEWGKKALTRVDYVCSWYHGCSNF